MYPLQPLTNPGTYVQGQLATFIITTIRSLNEPTGFTNPTLTIYDEDETSVVMAEEEMNKAPSGYYFLDWEVPDALAAGTYVAVFSSELDGQEYLKKQLITIISSDNIPKQTVLNASRESELMVGLYYMIKETQEIPMEFELAKISANRLKAYTTFKRWNFLSNIVVYKNQDPITSGFTIDYDRGEINFDSALDDEDYINVDYNFSWFSGEEMATFLNLALQEINIVPPGSANKLGNAPEVWYPAIIYGAARNVYRRLIHDISYQQPKLVYGLDYFKDAIDNFKTLKENYEKDFQELAKLAKRSTWPRIGLIVAPEFTMPGGRSRWFRYLYKG